MKKTILKIKVFGILIVVLVGLFVPIYQISAQSPTVMEDYTVLTPLPGTTKGVCDPNAPSGPNCKTDLKTYLEGFFKLAIGISAVFAVLMIVIGGFQYISTDALMKKEEGRNRIQNAVFGLVLVISAWLILATINPNLLRINLDIKSAPTSAPTFAPGGELVTPGAQMTPEQITLSNARRASLQAEGVDTYRGPCTQGQATGCVNLNGLTDTTKDGLVLTKLALTNSGCTSCQMIITAGTEMSVHAKTGDHPAGKAVDLKPDQALSTALGFPNPKDGDTKTKVYKVDGKPDITATFTYETLGGNAGGTSTGNHWHVVFK